MITLAGQSKIKAEGRDTVRVVECNIVLNDVLFVPNLQCNFISVGRVAVKDVEFNSREAPRINEEGKTVLCASKVGDLFLYTHCSRRR